MEAHTRRWKVCIPKRTTQNQKQGSLEDCQQKGLSWVVAGRNSTVYGGLPDMLWWTMIHGHKMGGPLQCDPPGSRTATGAEGWGDAQRIRAIGLPDILEGELRWCFGCDRDWDSQLWWIIGTPNYPNKFSIEGKHEILGRATRFTCWDWSFQLQLDSVSAKWHVSADEWHTHTHIHH